jgi:glucose-1-phosphate cytidylyltransferase
VTYGDGVSTIDISALIDFHQSHGRIATLTGINPAARFGELKLSGDKVQSFAEKPDRNGEYVNGGFFVFDRRIFDYLNSDDGCDLELGALEDLAKQGELMVFRHDGFWGCMDTQRDADWLRSLWTSGQAPWKRW